MMRSLFSGVSGLKSHQTRMDVIGNNIANVNTTGYKSKTLNFSDMLYQTTQAATGPNANAGTGGINPRQIGLGVKTAAINTSITQEGASQSTGNPFDLKLKGEAFFVVSDGTNTYYTRDGSFDVDKAGNLCMASTGYIVQGWGVDDEGNILKGDVGNINVMSKSTYPAASSTKATISGIIDENDSNLQTENGKLINFSINDARGYEYNLKFGILPQTSPTTDTRSILNTENEYTLKSPIYQVDASELTYMINGANKELKASDMPSQLLEKLEKAVWTVANGGTATGITGTHAFGVKDGAITVDLNAFIDADADLKDSVLANSELRSMNLTVNFSGGTGFTTTVSGYPLNNASIISVKDPAAAAGLAALYDIPTTPTNGMIECTPKFATATTIKQVYSDDDNNSITEYVFKDANGANVTIAPEHVSDVLRIIGLGSPNKTQNTYTTTESKESTKPEKGKYNLSLLGIVDSNGKEIDISALKNNGETSWGLSYNTDNGAFQYVGSEGNDTFTLALSSIDTSFSNITIDVSDTNNSDNEKKSTIDGLKDDGRKLGNLQGVSIGTEGIVTAKYTNGETLALGQVCVGTFANAMGLENQGDNLYSETANSGEVRYEDVKASGIGYMTSGVLEMSNVDLSQEFTDMITTQRGFQANSRIISVSDTLLEELVNLKR